MPSSTFSITLNNHLRKIEIYQVQGGDGWYVLVDNYLQAMIYIMGGKLLIYPNRGCELSGDDLAGIVDAVGREMDG